MYQPALVIYTLFNKAVPRNLQGVKQCTVGFIEGLKIEYFLQRLIMWERAHNADGITSLNCNRYSLLQGKGRAGVSSKTSQMFPDI